MKARKSRESAVTDPIARAIEGHLHSIEANGGGALRREATTDGWSVAFGSCQASGETYEIALVRIARLLLDDEHFKTELMKALRVHPPSFAGER